MNHSLLMAIVTGITGAFAAVGFVVSGSLQVFAPCRVLYRVHQPVQDSLACQSYAAINLASALFVLAALVLAVVTVGRIVLRWARGRTGGAQMSPASSEQI